MSINLLHNLGVINLIYYLVVVISLTTTFLLRKKRRICKKFLLFLIYLCLLPAVILQIISSKGNTITYLYLFTLFIPYILLINKHSKQLELLVSSLLLSITIFNALLIANKVELSPLDFATLILYLPVMNLSILMYQNTNSVSKKDIKYTIAINSLILFLAVLLNLIIRPNFGGFININYNTTLGSGIAIHLYYFIFNNLLIFNLLYHKYNSNNETIKFTKKHNFLVFATSFIISNVLINQLLFNKNFIKLFEFLDFNFGLKVNSLLADFFFLVVIVLLVVNITKNNKARMATLIIISFILNILHIIQMMITETYQLPLNYNMFGLAKGPKTEYNNIVSLMVIRDIIYYRLYLLLLPTVLLIQLILFLNDLTSLKTISKKITHKKRILCTNLKVLGVALFFILFGITQMVGLGYVKSSNFTDMVKIKTTWQVNGVYGYYLNFPFLYQVFRSNVTEEDKKTLQNFNYTNLSNSSKVLNNINNFKNLDEIKQVFKDKNIVMFTLESFSKYMLFNDPDNKFYPYRRLLLPDLYDLIDEGYLFNHFHAEEGAGHSTDGTFSLLSGLPNHGVLSHAFQFDKFKSDNLPKNMLPELLRNNNYHTSLVEFTTPLFYNLHKTSTHTYKFNTNYFYDEHNYLDDKYKISSPNNTDQTVFKNIYLENQYTKDLPKYQSKQGEISLKYNKNLEGLSDTFLTYFIEKHFKDKLKTISNNKQKQFINAYTMLPHIPNTGLHDFDVLFGLTSKNKILNPEIHNLVKNIKREDYRYLQYTGYINSFFKAVKKLINSLDNTIFFFSGDHTMSSMDPDSIRTLYNRELNKYELREKYREIFSMLYVPNDYKYNKIGLKEGLIKGEQNLIRSQLDFYTTLVEMLALDPKRKHYGVNLLTKEKKLVMDPRHNFIFSDDFILSPEFNNLTDKEQYFIRSNNNYSLQKILTLKNNFINFKIAYDKLVNTNNFSFLNS